MKIRFLDSIWWKLTLYFWGIIFTTLVFIGVGLSLTARWSFINYYAGELKNRGKQAVASLKMESGQETKGYISLSQLNSLTGQGWKIISLKSPEEIKLKEIPDLIINIKTEDIQKLKNGEQLNFTQKGTGIIERFVVCITPIKKANKIEKALVTVIPLSQPEEVRVKSRQNMIRSLFITALISFMVAFILAKTITEPVFKMKTAAEEMAGGNFKVPLKIQRKDEIGALARAIEEMSGKLESNNRIRNELLANISHELRTPLATIQGNVEAIMDGVVEDEKEKNQYLKTVVEQVQRLTILLEDLGDLTRFEAGQLSMEIETFSPRDIILSITKSMEIHANKKNIKIITQLPEKDIPVTGDPNRISQVFVNLINNAINHIPRGREIFVGMMPAEEEVEFYVKDTGDGIPEKEIEHIFERFYKVDKSRTKEGEVGSGSGLGLAIVKQILLSHKREIKVLSSPRGTHFSFSLPKAKGKK